MAEGFAQTVAGSGKSRRATCGAAPRFGRRQVLPRVGEGRLHAQRAGSGLAAGRLAEIGGTLGVESSPGNGSKVIAQLKLTPRGIQS